MKEAPIRIFVADDHTLFRDGLRALFASIEDIHVVGEASNGDEALQRIDELQPDVVMMDIHMPGMNGIDATRILLQTSPQVGIVFVTMLDDDDSVFEAMKAGARGYVLKGATQEEMLRVIRAVARGEAHFGPGIASRLNHFFANNVARGEQAFPELTEREREVLTLLAEGKNKQSIARELVISIKTVGNHLSNIYAKLQVADRAEAMLRAREAGLGKSSDPQR
jgi:DNA-binding NarL/FixJ family response regulator